MEYPKKLATIYGWRDSWRITDPDTYSNTSLYGYFKPLIKQKYELSLSQDTKVSLQRLSLRLKDIPPRIMERFRQKNASSQFTTLQKVLAYPWPCYSVTFSSPGLIGDYVAVPNEAFLEIRPVMRRPTGAAGSTFDNERNHVEVVKGKDSPLMQGDYLDRRRGFQDGFLRYVNSCDTYRMV